MTSGRPLGVLFLCTHNSARSILAECVLNRAGAGRFIAYSAGSQPKSAPNPMGLALLADLGYPVDGLRSKSWEEFAQPSAPALDFIFTVCDNAAGETCPLWPGRPVSAHWGLPDPSSVTGTQAERYAAFAETHRQLQYRIGEFIRLPFDALDEPALKQRLTEIGRSAAPSTTMGA